MEAFPFFFCFLFGRAPLIPKTMSLLPSSPKIITSASKLPVNKKLFSPDNQNPGGPLVIFRNVFTSQKSSVSFVTFHEVQLDHHIQPASLKISDRRYVIELEGVTLADRQRPALIFLLGYALVAFPFISPVREEFNIGAES